MKLNLHKKSLYFYSQVEEFDGFRKFNFFEDFEDISSKFNIKSVKKPVEYLNEIGSAPQLGANRRIVSKDFNCEFFACKKS